MIKGLLPLFIMGYAAFTACAGPLEAGFANPPQATKPWCYWYWFNDNISKEGITHDLEDVDPALPAIHEDDIVGGDLEQGRGDQVHELLEQAHPLVVGQR